MGTNINDKARMPIFSHLGFEYWRSLASKWTQAKIRIDTPIIDTQSNAWFTSLGASANHSSEAPKKNVREKIAAMRRTFMRPNAPMSGAEVRSTEASAPLAG